MTIRRAGFLFDCASEAKPSVSENIRFASEAKPSVSESIRFASEAKASVSEGIHFTSEAKASVSENIRFVSEAKASVSEDIRFSSEAKSLGSEGIRFVSEIEPHISLVYAWMDSLVGRLVFSQPLAQNSPWSVIILGTDFYPKTKRRIIAMKRKHCLQAVWSATVLAVFLLFPLTVGAQGRFPDGAKGFNLWPGSSAGSYYGVAHQGSSWFVISAQGSAGPFTSVQPLSTGETLTTTAFVVKDSNSWYLLGPQGEKLGPYVSLSRFLTPKGALESASSLYSGKRTDGKLDLLFSDGERARVMGSADFISATNWAVSPDGKSCAVAIFRGADSGILWDSVMLWAPATAQVVGMGFNNDVLLLAEQAQDKKYLEAITRRQGAESLQADSATIRFQDTSKLVNSLPVPPGYGRYYYGTLLSKQQFGETTFSILPELIEQIIPAWPLSGAHGFALRYQTASATFLLTQKGRFGPFPGSIVPENQFALSASGDAFAFTTGRLGAQYVHLGNTTYGPVLAVAFLDFDKDGRLFFTAARTSGELVYREGTAISELGDSARAIRPYRVDPRTGAKTKELFNGYFYVAKDGKTTLFHAAGPDGMGEAVGGPFDGDGYMSLYRFGDRQRSVFSTWGSPPKVFYVDAEKFTLAESATGFTFNADGSSFAFLEELGPEAIRLYKDSVVLGQFKSCGYPAYIPGTSELVYVSDGKGGLTLTRGSAKPLAVKGSRMDLKYPGSVSVSADGAIVALHFGADVPGAAKDAPAVRCTELMIGDKLYTGNFDEKTGVAIYWDPKAKKVVRIGE